MPLDSFFVRWVRNKLFELDNRIGDLPYRPPGCVNTGTPMLFGKVVNGGAIPNATNRVFLLNPSTVNGIPAENTAGTVASNALQKVPVFVVGSRVPVAGDYLQAFHVRGGWVAVAGQQCNWTFNIQGCIGLGLAGATVTLRQLGITKASGVTGDGTGGTTLGRVVLSVPVGTYDIEVIPASGFGFATFTGSNSHICNQTSTIQLGGDANNVCIAKCNYPVPRVLSMTNALGTHTFTYQGLISGIHRWTAPQATVPVATFMRDVVTGLCVPDGNPCKIAMTLSFNNSAGTAPLLGWVYNEAWGAISCHNCSGPSGTGEHEYAAGVIGMVDGVGSASAESCLPFSLSMNVPTFGQAGLDLCRLPNPGGGGIYTFLP